MLNDDRLSRALSLAHEAHRTQKRKGTEIPYISHPMAVAALTLEHGGNENQAIAALLHDVIEDGGADYTARIEEAFGSDVLVMVQDCTDGTAESKAVALTPAQKYIDWKTRKQTYLKHLRDKPLATPSLLVSACDKLHNARAILSDFRQLGAPLFDRFTAGRDGTLWYYDALAILFVDKQVAPAAQLHATVKELLVEAAA
ncbi:MAG TPA: HD domain-containing protein [Rhodanobacter sp.]